MSVSDPIGALVCLRTGRTLDQHAVDTHPAAAQLPGIAELVRHARHELMLTIDDLNQLFTSNADADAYRSPEAVLDPMLDSLLVFASQYLQSRALLDKLTTALPRRRRGTRPPQPPARRRYLNPGDHAHLNLPHTPVCIALAIAGRRARVLVTDVDAETSLRVGPSQLRLAHHDAGIYRDPVNGRLYTLDRTAA